MDARQLIESLVSSLAWATAIVVIARSFRLLVVQSLRSRASDASTAIAPSEGAQNPSVAFSTLMWQASGEVLGTEDVVPVDAAEGALHKDKMVRLYNLSTISRPPHVWSRPMTSFTERFGGLFCGPMILPCSLEASRCGLPPIFLTV